MTITEAAKLKGVSRGAIYKAIENNDIRATTDVHGTVVNREDVENYVPRAYRGKRGNARPPGVKGPGGRPTHRQYEERPNNA